MTNFDKQTKTMTENYSPAEQLLHSLSIKEEIQDRNYMLYTEKQEGFTLLKVLSCVEFQKYSSEIADPYKFYRMRDNV